MNNIIPEDVNPEWLSVVRRLQSVAKSNGLAVLNISILVDADGTPVAWTAPGKKLIEPKSMSGALLSLAVRGENIFTKE